MQKKLFKSVGDAVKPVTVGVGVGKSFFAI